MLPSSSLIQWSGVVLPGTAGPELGRRNGSASFEGLPFLKMSGDC